MRALVNVPCGECGTDRWTLPKNAARARRQLCRRCVNRSPIRLEALHRCQEEHLAAQAYVDEMAVVRLLAGMPVNSTRAERQAAVAALTARRVATRVIAERLRVTTRTVERLRARERVTA